MTEHQNRQKPISQPDRHSVHLALAFLFGAMDRQAPQQKCDEWFGVVMYHNGEGIVPSLSPAVILQTLMVDQSFP